MKLLSLQDVAERTSSSVGFWRKQVLLRRISVVKLGRLVRLNPEDVATFLAERTRPAIGRGLSSENRADERRADARTGR